ncbi:ShlB/FhaC/HecB family hemolysin secretion/activation protein [Sporomusa sp. KB1]|uniref:ShlB/FhaC/HecB family hemolysin secretion/activation protein n=1 Tax=Sporomusa sp. KB1 TaxID=943346 RepID=UPI0011AC040B|nr:ShlB/FhaC/HecB family hemolysin secretion/activation protein [Sporomusa sp. KB1]TWH49539.1 hemolysin activation/secretion protein [Sporomusa sp. KB1]
MKNVSYRTNKKLVFLLTAASLLTTYPALAAPSNTSYSGTALEGVKPPTVQAPAQKGPSITVEEREPVVSADGQQKIPVKGFRISGESPLPESELLPLIQKEAGQEITLNGLNELAVRLTKHLRQQGYLVAFAYIPAQTIKDGNVEIAVVPGKYGQVKISGDGHIDQEQLKAMLFCTKPGMLITRAPLERALLLINDLSGVTVKATLSPGQEAGTADLILETGDTDKTSGAVYADNWGNRYTGRTRYGTQITFNNFSDHYGDALTIGGLTTSDGINNYNFGYSAPLGYDGAKAEVKYSHVGYTLGEEYADLGATGRAAVTSYAISYPFIRSRSFSLYGTVGYDVKHLKDNIADYGSYSPRSSKLWNLGLSGSFADIWLGGGNNAFSLTHYRGNLDINDASAQANDVSTARTSGDFNKTVLTYQRQQYVAQNLNFYLSFTGQLADKNLDSSEKLYLGGADGVRSYPQGEASGDQGYKLTGEFRWRLPGLSGGPNNLYLNTFCDYGNVMVNKHPYSTDDNRRSLMAAGLGLLWTRDRDFVIRMDYAWKLDNEQATADADKSGRFWLQGVKYF